VCRLLCPDLCITRDAATGRIVIDLDICKGCGICAHYCPKGAIRMVMEKAGDEHLGDPSRLRRRVSRG